MCLSPITFGYLIYLCRTPVTARARAPPRAHTHRAHLARTHAHSSLHTDTHTARVDTGQCSVQESGDVYI